MKNDGKKSQISESNMQSVERFLLNHPDAKVRSVAKTKYNQKYQNLGINNRS